MPLRPEDPQPAQPPPGPGDDDGKPSGGTPDEARKPLGPGDSERDKVATPEIPRAALGPGESDGTNVDDGHFDIVAPRPARPGDPASGPRHLSRMPRQRQE